MTAASVMMALGLYEPMMASLAAMDLPVLLSTLPGMGLTILAFARLMGWVFREHYPVAAHGILGVVLASTLVILPTAYQGGWEMALSAACCAARMIFVLLGKTNTFLAPVASMASKRSSMLGFIVCPPDTTASAPRSVKIALRPSPAATATKPNARSLSTAA